jgi:hypothetical protein
MALAALGAALPYTELARFVTRYGADPRLALEQLFATPISSFFGADVVISGITVMALAIHERRLLGSRRLTGCLAATLLIGPSCGLPLLLYFRSGEARQGSPRPRRG